MWTRVLSEALPRMRKLVPAGSRVLEVGYGNGLLTCYLCRELGWRVTGLDINSNAQCTAMSNSVAYGLSDRVDFCCCEPTETRAHRDAYDAVFIKTVLYGSVNLTEYGQWLDWINSVLKPGGVLINFETGRANALTQCYRRVRRRTYTGLCLYTGDVEALYDARFDIIDRKYYGGYSQFLTPIPFLYRLALKAEEALKPRHANNSFIVSIIAKKPDL